MRQILTKWWPKNKPIPDGWRLIVPQRISHHSQWSVLIEKINA